VSDPDSADYLRFKSVSEIAAMIGGSDTEIHDVAAWLTSLDGYVSNSLSVSPLRDHVTARFLPARPESFDHTVPSHIDGVEFVVRNDPLQHHRPTTSAEAAHRHREVGAAAGMGYTIKAQKEAYGIPVDLEATNDATTQMVWGPGTFGYSKTQLFAFKESQCPKLNMDKVVFDTANHGTLHSTPVPSMPTCHRPPTTVFMLSRCRHSQIRSCFLRSIGSLPSHAACYARPSLDWVLM
jgi:hypothetical protein